MLLLILFGFLAGLVTVAAPCILPVLPIVLSSSVAGGKWRPVSLILGLIGSFSLFTLAITQLVALVGISPSTLRLVAVGILALLGLGMVLPGWNARIEALFGRLPGLVNQRERSGWLGGLLTGASLGLVWAPCAGPVLAAITTLAATQRVTLAAVAITAAYAAGVGAPLLALSYGGRSILRRVPALGRQSARLQRIFGAVMVVTALLIAFNVDTTVTVWATGALPSDWTSRIQAFEDTQVAQQQLDRLTGRAQTAGLPAASSANVDAAPAGPADQVASAMSDTTSGEGAASPSPASGGESSQAQAGAGKQAATATPAATSVPPTVTPGMAATEASAGATAPATATASPEPAMALPDLGPAPDFAGINHWINSAPLTLSQLRGKVVLVDFWTYSCINCLRTLPYVTAWYEKYKDQGLVVVGVHSPEFAFEKDTTNVEQAVQRYHITYPVAQDNAFNTWQAYQNRYWPAEYFIDAEGHLRHTHFGEGSYDESERVIQQLLDEAGAHVQDAVAQAAPPPVSQMQTPETYLGGASQDSFSSPQPAWPGMSRSYTLPADLPLDHWALTGLWHFEASYAEAGQPRDTLRLHFRAKDVYLVMTSDRPVQATVSLVSPQQTNHSEDLDAQGRLTVSASRLYHLVSLKSLQEGTLDLQFDQPSVRVYAFTFGS